MGKTHAEFAVLLKMLIGYEFVMDSYELVMSACEISMIYLCIFETIYAVLLLRVGRVVVHLCDHNYIYGRIGGLRQQWAGRWRTRSKVMAFSKKENHGFSGF